MKGKWKGTYWFKGNVHESLKNRKTNFELTVEGFTNAKISGVIKDDIKTGGTKGIGHFSGTVKNNKIKFIKRMPVSTVVFPDGTRLEEDKPHRPIYYKGILNETIGVAKGTWKFKKGIGFKNGKIVFYPGTKGEWEMKKES